MDTLNIVAGIFLLLMISFFWTALVRKIVNVMRHRQVKAFSRGIWPIFLWRLAIGIIVSLVFVNYNFGLFSILLDFLVVGVLCEYYDKPKKLVAGNL